MASVAKESSSPSSSSSSESEGSDAQIDLRRKGWCTGSCGLNLIFATAERNRKRKLKKKRRQAELRAEGAPIRPKVVQFECTVNDSAAASAVPVLVAASPLAVLHARFANDDAAAAAPDDHLVAFFDAVLEAWRKSALGTGVSRVLRISDPPPTEDADDATALRRVAEAAAGADTLLAVLRARRLPRSARDQLLAIRRDAIAGRFLRATEHYLVLASAAVSDPWPCVGGALAPDEQQRAVAAVKRALTFWETRVMP
jgi:hypothetical protein